MSHSLRHAMAALLLTALPASAAAQSLWPDSLRGRGELGAEWVRPTFESSDDAYSGDRGVWILSGRLRASDRLNVVAAGNRLVATSGGGGSTLGNPYVGIEFLRPDHTPEFSVGLRFLVADEGASAARAVGFVGDFDRFEAMVTRAYVATVTGYHQPLHTDDGTFARVRFGATFIHPTGSGLSGGGDLYFNYGVRIGRERPDFTLAAELTGRWFLTSEGMSFTQSTTHQAALSATFLSGAVRPTLAVRVPIDDGLKDALQYAVTFGVTVGVE